MIIYMPQKRVSSDMQGKFIQFDSSIFLFDPVWGGEGEQTYGQITCWGKKLLKGDEKGGGNAYFFPNW